MSPTVRVVLVEPSHPGNIGASARAMKTMGLHELYLVNPTRFPDPQADWRSAGALDLVENAFVVTNLRDALRGCTYVAGTTGRSRHIPWPCMDASEFALSVNTEHVHSSHVAVVFGRETNGLTNEELQMCHVHVRIPTHEAYSSLNLAMSVQVIAYELFKARSKSPAGELWDRKLAEVQEVENMLDHLRQALDQLEFYSRGSPKHSFTRLRRMFMRMRLDETEVNLMRSMFNHIDRLHKSHQ